MPTLGYLSLLIIAAVVGNLALLFSVLLTNPSGIGPVGVTVWFVVFLMTVAADLALLLYGIKVYLKLHQMGSSRLRYSWRQGLLLSGWITGILALSSLRQINLRDAILLGLLLVIVEVYVRLRWP